MKKILIAVFVFFGFFTFAQNHSIQIQIKNLPPTDVYLADFYGDKNNMLDTAFPDTSGLFSFQMKQIYPAGMYRVFLDKDVFFDLIYNLEDIKIQSEFEYLYDSLKVLKSEENKIYYTYLKAGNAYQRKFDLLAPLVTYFPQNDSFYTQARDKYIRVQKNYIALINNLIEKNPDSYAVKVIKRRQPIYFEPGMNDRERREYVIDHFFDNVDFSDVDLIRSNVYTTLAIEYMSLYSNPNLNQDQLQDEFIKAVDEIMLNTMQNNLVYEFVVEYLVGGFERYHFDKVLDYIAENYAPEQCENEERKTDLQTRLKKYAELSVGKPAPDINLPDEQGRMVNLYDIDTKYTLVIFWASWCPHCNEMMPKIKNIYESSLSSDKMEILSVSIDNDNAEWQKNLSENNYPWIDVSDLKGWDSPAAIDYNIYATPTMFLLDKNKKIVAKPITFDELKNALFKENILR
ncbi:MAG: redoxin domain-containing protein, partial [Bacteroidales bacterium]|nr:redoxin domain-containing protein [Bacteroidales bacterium]